MKVLPIGIENFKTMIDKDVYYVDKTDFISDIINEQLILYTRPRRFGKTLNMSMLYYFFSNKEKENAYLFNNLNVTKYPEVMKHQNQYPVIFITLKDMKAMTFLEQKEQFAFLISNIISKYNELFTSQRLDKNDIDRLQRYKKEISTMIELKNSLLVISQCLEKHYGKKVILLIDEYDVPLQSAYINVYYDQMVDFLRSVFSSALKTNDALEKGIMTGCLRISKESIFTGLNNFNVYSILDNFSSSYFGFRQTEVEEILNDYNCLNQLNNVKEWYDGYLFGNTEIYNPWSVLKFVQKYTQEKAKPEPFWANTSSNDIVYNYIKNADESLHEDFEILMQRKTITKIIKPELTYRDMDNIQNIYSFLLLTGYLKIVKDKGQHVYELIIPNQEVYEIYDQSFKDYFTDFTIDRKKDLYQLLIDGETDKANILLNEILNKSISYYDNQENFYHGFLVGLFSNLETESNKESGDGRFDIVILPRSILGTAIIIECKHSSQISDLLKDAQEGADQIVDKNYFEGIKNKGYFHSVGYGISFHKKQCYIVKV